MTLPRYGEYKDSGAAWLGKVPGHWVVGAVKRFFSVLDSRRVPLSAEERSSRNGEFPYFGASGVIDSIDDYIFDEDLVLVSEDGANLLNRSTPIAFVARGKYWVNNHAHILKPLDGALTYWAERIEAVELTPFITGSAQPKLTVDALANIVIAVPPALEEREAIEAFILLETGKIDALVAEQEKLIALLKEKRQAVISHAVTKGLDPTAPMKDSGIEWLSDVPAHWDVLSAKRVTKVFVPQRNKPELNVEGEGVYWATMDDLKGEEVTQTSAWVSEVAANIAGSRILSAGAVIASCVGNFGVASISAVDLVINQQLQAFIPSSAISAAYMRHYICNAKTYFEWIGTSTTVSYVNQQGFECIPVTLPPIAEQENIVSHLALETTKLDALTAEAGRAISLLKERRSALISAAVTGKIDVRGLVSIQEEAA